jgi:hypothetical protein
MHRLMKNILILKLSSVFKKIFFSHLSYIYLGSSVCHHVCHPVIFLSSCHSCGTLSYSLCFNNQTDPGDETEGFQREGLEMER